MVNMINIKIKNDLIRIDGHAKYDEVGKDIVCASVSSIVYTTINGIFNIDQDAISFKDEKRMEIKIKHHSEVIDILIQNMLDLLDDLAKQYPKNINLDKGE